MNNEFDPDKLFVVGIAASAGGLPAISELLSNAACHGCMSFVVVSHLDRFRPSELAQILERASQIRSLMIEDQMPIQNCHRYTTPPNHYVTIEDKKFRLSQRPEEVANESGNVLFDSLSRVYGSNAIGVVLSGANVGADGSIDTPERIGHDLSLAAWANKV